MKRNTFRRFRHSPGSAPNEKGVALILVLWMLMLLTIVANSVANTARTEAQVAANLVSLARIEAAADAGIFRAIMELSIPNGSPGRWQSNGREYPWSFAGLDGLIRIRGEAAKVDLNEAPRDMLARLFQAFGRADADALADAIIDWRDQDGLRNLNGAEREDYVRAGKSYGPANAPFESVDELGLVLGIDSSTFRMVREFVTIYSLGAAIDISGADRPVLLTLPGATPELVDAYIERRRAALENGQPPPAFGSIASSIPGENDYYSVRVKVDSGDNTYFAREAVVRLTGDPAKPFVILAWYSLRSDNVPAFADIPTN